MNLDKTFLIFQDLKNVTDLLTGKGVRQNICHMWYEEGGLVLYNGKIEKLKEKGKKYVVAYWTNSETYDDATDFIVTPSSLAADFIANDLLM